MGLAGGQYTVAHGGLVSSRVGGGTSDSLDPLAQAQEDGAMGTVGYLALAVAAAALAIALIRSTRRARARESMGEWDLIVAGLRSGRLARDPHILDNAPPERWTDR